jgi:uncharacterized membrane protein
MENTINTTKFDIKPLNKNAFLAFFQKIWRWWLGVWYNFSDKHPKLASGIYLVFFFLVFSEGVTVIQYLIMTFLPYLFVGLSTQPFIWPAVNLGSLTYADGTPLQWAIFNEPMRNAAGAITTDPTLAAAQGGLGNFIAFEIAVFIAQCINLPLQRNITYRSHGNVVWQSMWYFVGWILISLFVNAVWGICSPFLTLWGWEIWLQNILKTFITGGLSMIIFFFIFMIIFPNYKKVRDNKNKKLDALKAKLDADPNNEALKEKYNKINAEAEIADENFRLSEAEKNNHTCETLANSKAIAANAMIDKYSKKVESLDNAKKTNGNNVDEINKLENEVSLLGEKVNKAHDIATKSFENKVKASEEYTKVNEEVKNLRAKRA